MAAIEAALDSMLDFSGPTIDSNIIEKFVCRITPVDNGHYRWDLNFAPNKKQAVIGAIEGRKGKVSVEIVKTTGKPVACTAPKRGKYGHSP